MIFFAFILEALSIQDFVTAIVAIVGGFIALRMGLQKSASSGYKALLEIKTQERDELSVEVKELKEENRTLRRELSQRIEINQQDQETIRELRRLTNG